MKTTQPRWGRCKRLAWGCLGLTALAVFAAWGPLTASAPPPTKPVRQPSGTPGTLAWEVPGRTQCLLTRKGAIAPVPLHPVTAVLVEPGSRVKKGQPLVQLDDDEPQADVRAKRAALESAQVILAEARRYLGRLTKAYSKGAIPEQRYHEAVLAARKAERDERVARAALDSARAELEHYQVTAQIDGVVSWLEVHPGMVSRPGTTVWGEILDLRELDVRCELTLAQAQRVVVGQAAQVIQRGKNDVFGTGRVVYVGVMADKRKETVPVLVRVPNPGERLRSGEPVKVRFSNCPTVSGSK
jgi:RND family efflux transporter MFP subunit